MNLKCILFYELHSRIILRERGPNVNYAVIKSVAGVRRSVFDKLIDDGSQAAVRLRYRVMKTKPQFLYHNRLLAVRVANCSARAINESSIDPTLGTKIKFIAC